MKIFKFILLIFLALIIFLKRSPEISECNIITSKMAIPPVIFYETTIDGPYQHVLLTRFLHNKAGIFGSEFAKCYFNYVSPNTLIQFMSIFGLIGFGYFFYNTVTKKKWIFIIVSLILPVFPFLNLPLLLFTFAFEIFAIIGLAWLLKLK